MTTHPEHHPAEEHGHDHPADAHQHDHAADAHEHDHAAEVHGHDHAAEVHGHDHPAEAHEHDHPAGEHGHDHAAGEHGHDHQHATGLKGLVLSVVKPHSHDAADSFDATLEASAEGMRTLKISLAGLAVTALIQVVVFSVSGSIALLADTIHNFADALTAIPLAAAFVLSRRPPTTRYTYGFGRSEDLAGVAIVLTIAASSILAAAEAVDRLVHPRSVHQLALVAVAGLVGFAGNELVARYRIRVGRRIGSAALEADGYHARTDGFTSLAVVLGAAGVAAGWRLADPIVGLAITVAILFVVKNAAREIYRRLMDAVDPALVDKVTSVLAGVDGIVTVDQVRIRWVGHELHAVADVTSEGTMSLAQAHDVAEHAHHHLLHEVPRLREATIHTSPFVAGGADPHARTAHHRDKDT